MYLPRSDSLLTRERHLPTRQNEILYNAYYNAIRRRQSVGGSGLVEVSEESGVGEEWGWGEVGWGFLRGKGWGGSFGVNISAYCSSHSGSISLQSLRFSVSPFPQTCD